MNNPDFKNFEELFLALKNYPSLLKFATEARDLYQARNDIDSNIMMKTEIDNIKNTYPELFRNC
jgi:hypothetical protein